MTKYKLTRNDPYIRFGHLYLDEDEKKAIFLGYDMKLTKSEYHILKAITVNSKKPINAEAIALNSGLEISKENVTFHISNINQKAKAIGNRPIIKNMTKIGYFLNEEM